MNEPMNPGANAAPKQAKQHPAIELEEVVEVIQDIDKKQAAGREQREGLESRVKQLVREVYQLTERASFVAGGPTTEDADEERAEQEHWESVRERRRNGA